MDVVDFRRSFLTFRLDLTKHPPATVTHVPPYDLNNARVQIECRCLVHERKSGREEMFVLGASCKTERVGVDASVWLEPNADFAPVLSDRHFLHIKTYDRVGRKMSLFPPSLGQQGDRHAGLVAEAFDGVRIDLAYCEAEALNATPEIVAATLNNEPLVATTRLESDRYLVDLQYPIKTMNANERDGIYQTDTGPVLLPDLSLEPDDMIRGLEMAYCAFNQPGWIEFIVRAPCEIEPGVLVHHYCRTQRFDAKNEVFRILPRPAVNTVDAGSRRRPHFARDSVGSADGMVGAAGNVVK